MPDRSDSTRSAPASPIPQVDSGEEGPSVTVGQTRTAYEVMFKAVEDIARVLGLSDEQEGVLAQQWALTLLDVATPDLPANGRSGA